ncbi:NAD(P)-binding protein [Laetiporus sulphureus 93-53]|uniref:NAD(P)-binding protein n=1 Tax=Laetiporus sulphureus 93-53 TaxID=1314785 RepID=A0A165GLN4_9APHY|nr:NAD(P)-binding protein [Laetiporus sulphureus 93-53]KZT10522.1 NAD(P)-binding protein [Laetiporus sulphureus 93-53]
MVPNTKDSYLITGGNGLLGRHIAKMLLERGETSVAVFDIAPSAESDERIIEFLGDVTNKGDLSNAVKKCNATCIFHTAALVQGAPRDAMFHVNVQGTQQVIAVARNYSVSKLVFTSSASVVFDGTDQDGVDETARYPETPFDDYNASKAEAERLVLAADEQYDVGLKTVSLRVAGLFGPGDRHAIPGFMNVLESGRTGMQIGNNQNLFDFTYIPNAALAHLLAADRLSPSHPKYSFVHGEAFFITNGAPMPFWDFPRALWKEAGHVPTKITVIPRFLAMIIAFFMEIWGWITRTTPTLTRFRVTYVTTTRWCDITRAREALDYEPKYSIEEGIRDSVEWWKESQQSREKKL